MMGIHQMGVGSLRPCQSFFLGTNVESPFLYVQFWYVVRTKHDFNKFQLSFLTIGKLCSSILKVIPSPYTNDNLA
jgi:hypothetical protein